MHLDRVATRPPSLDSSLVTPRSARRAPSLVSLSPPLPLLRLLTFVLILRVKGISHLSPLPIPLPRDHLRSSFLPLPLALFSFPTLQAHSPTALDPSHLASKQALAHDPIYPLTPLTCPRISFHPPCTAYQTLLSHPCLALLSPAHPHPRSWDGQTVFSRLTQQNDDDSRQRYTLTDTG